MSTDFKPMYSADRPSYGTYANLQRPTGSVKQAAEYASRPLYKNTTPTVNIPQQAQGSPPAKKPDNTAMVKQLGQIAKKAKAYSDAQKASQIAYSNEGAMTYEGIGGVEPATTPVIESAATEVAGGEVVAETATAEIAATGEAAGLAEAGVATTEAGMATTSAGEAVVAAETASAGTAAAEAGTGAAAAETSAGTTASTAGSTGPFAIVAAIIAAEHMATSYNTWRYTDPDTGELVQRKDARDRGAVRTGDIFSGQPMTDPGATALLGNNKQATPGEKFDAKISKGQFGEDTYKAGFGAMHYWTDPASSQLGMAADRWIGGDSGAVVNPVGRIFSMF